MGTLKGYKKLFFAATLYFNGEAKSLFPESMQGKSEWVWSQSGNLQER
jgi:hypothetical protein